MTASFDAQINHLHQATEPLRHSVHTKVNAFVSQFESAKPTKSLPLRLRQSFSLDRFRAMDDNPPPQLPDPNMVMQEAQARAMKTGIMTLGVGVWVEGFKLYVDYRQGKPLTGFVVWTTAKKVGRTSLNAAMYAGRRHMLVTGLDSLAKVVAWQTAKNAKDSVVARAVHGVAKRFAGKANIAVSGVEIFLTMHRDIRRFRKGELSQPDFYRNCALTGVSVAAPLAGGAVGGPIGATVGAAVAIGAGMMKR